MKRLICTILMLCTLVCLFASCAQTAVEQPENTTAAAVETVITEAVPEETSDPDYTDDLPQLNYNGTEINVGQCDREWWADEVCVEAQNGEIVNDAVWKRNLSVEERLNVKINCIKVPYNNNNAAMIEAVKKAYTAGDKTYDICYSNSYHALMGSTTGCFHNMKKIDTIDLDKKYWSQNLNDTFEYHGMQFVATGSIVQSTIRFAFVTFFNKTMFDEFNKPYLYEYVSNNTWTLDKMYTLINDFYVDTNGSLTSDDGDNFGWICNDYIGSDTFWVSCQCTMIAKNADGDFEWVLDTQRLSDMVDKLILMYNAKGSHHFAHSGADTEQNSMRDSFAEGGGAMATMRLIECEAQSMRSMTAQYGIVPMPKFDENQQSYYTHLHDQFSIVAICATVEDKDTEMMGAFLEAMASQSYKDVYPAYYEVTLKFKYQSDPTAWEMLDTVVENINTDPGIVYNSTFGSPYANLRTIMANRNNTVSSIYKSSAKTIKNYINVFNKKMNAIDR